jgi:uncharacterized protein (TIGR03083 family)
LHGAVSRLVGLLRSVNDLSVPSRLPSWTLGDVGTHLGAVHLAFSSAFTHEFTDWDAVLPAEDGTSLHERIAAVSAKVVSRFGADERERIDEFIAERAAAFLDVTDGLDPETHVATPWYGTHVGMTLATATGILLSETLLHGRDIALGARRPWTINPPDARLVLGQVMPAMMPLTLNVQKARGVNLAFDLDIQGGPRLAVVVGDAKLTVTRDAPARAYDCRVIAEPTTFLLLSFGRTSLWKEIARGRMRAAGRKPWLGPRLRELIVSP